MGMYTRRVGIDKGDRGGDTPPSDPKFAEKFPAVYEHLTLRREEDGTLRETSTVLVFAEGGQFKACVNDRENGLNCFVSAETWEGLWKAVEATLREGKGDWRVPRKARGR